MATWGNHIQRVKIVINDNIIEQVTDFSRAKTMRPSGLSDGFFGSGGTNKHSSVANSQANSFPAAPALRRPYFWDHPRIWGTVYQNTKVI
jgi:hypothetical protein